MVGSFVAGPLPVWAIVLYQTVTLLSYINSAINPLLYAFLTDNFRRTLSESFQRASRTAASSLVARGLAVCGHALGVRPPPPLLLPPPVAETPPRPGDAAALPAEGPRDDDGGLKSAWLEPGNYRTSSIALHVVLDD